MNSFFDVTVAIVSIDFKMRSIGLCSSEIPLLYDFINLKGFFDTMKFSLTCRLFNLTSIQGWQVTFFYSLLDFTD